MITMILLSMRIWFFFISCVHFVFVFVFLWVYLIDSDRDLFLCFELVLQSKSYRRLWGPVRQFESLHPDANPRGYYAGLF